MIKSVSVLMRNLYDQNPETRSRAAMDLGEKQAIEAISSLVKAMLTDVEPNVRSVCAEALGMIADPSVLPELVGALEEENEKKVRTSIDWAINAISKKIGRSREEAIKEYGNKRARIIDRSVSKSQTKIQREKTDLIDVDATCFARISTENSTQICGRKAKINYEYELIDNLFVVIPLCEEHYKQIQKK